jgi:hypothetical protein
VNRVELCKACDAPIVFARQIGGAPGHRANPIDATPSDKGNIRLFDDGRYLIVAPKDRSSYVHGGVALHTSHFATCPRAEQFRKQVSR